MKTLIATVFALLISAGANSQDKNKDFQFGKPESVQMEMKTYSRDTTAPAVILYENSEVYYLISQRGEINQYRTVTRRIKVLKKEGTSYGNLEIMLYSPDPHTCTLEKLEAFSFNLENGKLVKTPLKKQLIFKEKVSESRTVVKTSIPDIKVGSIIEYRYTVRDDLIFTIPSHEFQHGIPVEYSRAKYSIPEYFRFNILVSGYHHIDIQRSSESKTAFLGGYEMSYSEDLVTGIAENIPALKNEPYVWNYEEYISRISLELDEYRFPGQLVQKISTDWKSVCNTLEKSRFGTHLKMSNPLKKEMEGLFAETSSDEDKIRAILKLLKSRIKWNGQIALTANSPKSALEKGEGNSADINFILKAMLEDAGIAATPMLLNPRYLDRIRFRATLEDINYFILQAKLSDGRICYLDGTNEFSDINIMSEALLVDRAHLYGDFSDKFHDLTSLTNNSTRKAIAGELDPSGIMKTHIRIQYNNMDAFMANNNLAQYNSEEEYIESLEKKLQKTVNDFKLEKSNTKVTESYSIEYAPVSTGEFIYIDAIMFPDFSGNPFTATERKLPVEFDHTKTSRIDFTFVVPDGYTIEEMPKSMAISACGGGLQARLAVAANNNVIQVSYTLNLKRIIFTPQEYGDISAFFAKVMELSGQQIVLKKIGQ